MRVKNLSEKWSWSLYNVFFVFGNFFWGGVVVFCFHYRFIFLIFHLQVFVVVVVVVVAFFEISALCNVFFFVF